MADDDKTPDPRPRPKFGELAPEGWVWHPPKDSDRLDTAHPIPDASHDLREQPRPAPAEVLAQAAGQRPVPKWNQTVTIVLMIVGIIGLFLSMATIQAIPQSIQMVYANEGLGTYKPAATVNTLIFAAQLTMVAIWVISGLISVILLTRRRLAFYVPIIGGVIAFVALFVFLSAIVATDPTLIDFYSRLSA